MFGYFLHKILGTFEQAVMEIYTNFSNKLNSTM
jgi:hypothetical protein